MHKMPDQHTRQHRNSAPRADLMSVDQSLWQVEVNGWPLFCARTFLLWLNFLPESLDLGWRITTAQSWPEWREQALSGSLKSARQQRPHAPSWPPSQGRPRQ